MLVTQFPNINWLKRQIQFQFQDQQGPNGVVLPFKGWPTVILQTQTKKTIREDIKGPLSIFLNKKGSSTIGVEGKQIMIKENAYVISNNNTHYDLLIREQKQTETFNIHFGTKFIQDAWYYLNNQGQQLLDNPIIDNKKLPSFSFNASFRSFKFNQLCQELEKAYKIAPFNREKQENILLSIFQYILQEQQKDIVQIHKLSSIKKSTKEELMKRLHWAVDYIYAYYDHNIQLEELAEISCLSKFHFLRSFKDAFGCTPLQFIKKIRIEQALKLLKSSNYSIQDIAFEIGIENASSLSRMFYKQLGHYPSHYRNSK